MRKVLRGARACRLSGRFTRETCSHSCIAGAPGRTRIQGVHGPLGACVVSLPCRRGLPPFPSPSPSFGSKPPPCTSSLGCTCSLASIYRHVGVTNARLSFRPYGQPTQPCTLRPPQIPGLCTIPRNPLTLSSLMNSTINTRLGKREERKLMSASFLLAPPERGRSLAMGTELMANAGPESTRSPTCTVRRAARSSDGCTSRRPMANSGTRRVGTPTNDLQHDADHCVCVFDMA